MPPKKPVAPKKTNTPNAAPLAALLIGLALSAYNLALMTSAKGNLDGMTRSFSQVQDNYAMRRSPMPVVKPVQEAPKCEEPKPPVVFSVVKFREGEEALLRANLAEPLAAFYAESRWPVAVSAVLIERKNASSKDVSVRIFFADGVEGTFLWPSTNAENGMWTPPCTIDQAKATVDAPLCPPTFAARYPDLVAE